MRHVLGAVILAMQVALAGATGAQAPGEPRRLGLLLPFADCPAPRELVESLAALGWVEGKTVLFDCLSAIGRRAELGRLAGALVTHRPDVLATNALPGVRAAIDATRTIPIVMLDAADPMRWGLVDSLSRPGGNVTDLVGGLGELDSKRIQLLKELMPGLKRLAMIVIRPSGEAIVADYVAGVDRDVARAADQLGLSYQRFDVARAEEIPGLIADLAGHGFDAIYLPLTPNFGASLVRVGQALRASGLPSIGSRTELAEAGVLLTYGPDRKHNAGRAASYIDKILKGAKPADLPVEEPSEFDFAINLTTAKVLGIDIPPALMLRATRLIEE